MHVLWTQLEGGGATHIQEHFHSVQLRNKNTFLRSRSTFSLFFVLWFHITTRVFFDISDAETYASL